MLLPCILGIVELQLLEEESWMVSRDSTSHDSLGGGDSSVYQLRNSYQHSSSSLPRVELREKDESDLKVHLGDRQHVSFSPLIAVIDFR